MLPNIKLLSGLRSDQRSDHVQRHFARPWLCKIKEDALQRKGKGKGTKGGSIPKSQNQRENDEPSHQETGNGNADSASPLPPLPQLPQLPRLAVLIDAHTASSAEVLAGALLRNGAVTIGQPTFGKDTSQAIVYLMDGRAISFTAYVLGFGGDLPFCLRDKCGEKQRDRRHSGRHVQHVPTGVDPIVPWRFHLQPRKPRLQHLNFAGCSSACLPPDLNEISRAVHAGEKAPQDSFLTNRS